jgi:hypothetical protein
MKLPAILIAVFALAWVLPAQAQRQLLCNPDEQCSITCYQDGMDKAEKVFHREKVDTLQIDINARVLKIEMREQAGEKSAYDYFILGSEMSCSIQNMRGVHD